MSIGERGPVGDHGQAGADGREGQTGAAGTPGMQGEVGPIGPPGSVLTKSQTLFGFLFVVVAFVVLAFIEEGNGNRIDDGVQRQDRFLTEICQRKPDLAPATCSLPR